MRIASRKVQAGVGHGGRLALLAIGLALVLNQTAYPVQAHGGGALQLANTKTGPYRASVWTQPDPIRVGQVHFTIAVSEASQPGAREGEAGEPVLDARVKVQLEAAEPGGEKLIAFATRENAVNKLFYEVDFNLPADGRWQVTIEVQGPDGGGSAAFEIEALPPSALARLGTRYLPMLGGAGLVMLVTIWWMWPSRGRDNRDHRQTRGSRETGSRRPKTVGDRS